MALVVLGAGGVVTATAPMAAAAGDVSLDALIVAPSPSAAWQLAPSAEVAPIVSRITKFDEDAISPPGAQVEVAAELWTSSASDSIVAATLVQWPSGLGNLDQMVASGVRQECVATTGNNPDATGSLSTIPGSVTASCTGNGVVGAIVAAYRGDVSELIETYSLGPAGVPLPAAQLDAMATTQFGRLPAPPSSAAPVVGGVVAAVVVVGFLVGLVRRSGRRGRRGVAVAPVGFPTGVVSADVAAWGSWPVPTAGSAPPAQAGFAPTIPSAVQAQPTIPSAVQAQPTVPSAVQAQPTVPSAVQAQPTIQQEPASGIGGSLAPLGGVVGWHPVGGDPLHLHYWDGSRWASTVRWDGSVWREDESS